MHENHIKENENDDEEDEDKDNNGRENEICFVKSLSCGSRGRWK